VLRSWLLPIVGLSLILPGILDLHVHADGTCHAHPFAPEEDDDDDGNQPATPGHRHSPWDTGCDRTLLPTDASVSVKPASAPTDLTVTDSAELPVYHIPCPFACGPPTRPATLPTYLSLRHLLI
jgi:hypothetical protein